MIASHRRDHNRYVAHTSRLLYDQIRVMTSQELKRWLQNQGCTFEPGRGGHLIVRRGRLMSVIPMHGKQKDLGIGLVTRIKKDLGLK